MKKYYYSFAEYVLMFLFASLVGWIYEIICVYIVYGRYYDRGILHLPICPIYGVGVLLLYLMLHKVKSGMVIFAASVIITTVVELVTSYVAEYRFHIIMWTYEGWPLNFQNRISAVSSCIFGAMALFFLKVMQPNIEKIFASKYRNIVSMTVCIILIASVVWELSYILK